MTASPWGCFSTMLLWLAHRTWNLFCDPRGDCLGLRGAFLSCDFGLLRIGSSLAVQSGSLDSFYSSSGTSSSSAWALGLILNGPESPDPLAPQKYKYIYITLTMQLTGYKYIFQLPKHTKSLPLPQHFPSLNTYVSYK